MPPEGPVLHHFIGLTSACMIEESLPDKAQRTQEPFPGGGINQQTDAPGIVRQQRSSTVFEGPAAWRTFVDLDRRWFRASGAWRPTETHPQGQPCASILLPLPLIGRLRAREGKKKGENQQKNRGNGRDRCLSAGKGDPLPTRRTR